MQAHTSPPPDDIVAKTLVGLRTGAFEILFAMDVHGASGSLVGSRM
jgi:hypothetical protein